MWELSSRWPPYVPSWESTLRSLVGSLGYASSPSAAEAHGIARSMRVMTYARNSAAPAARTRFGRFSESGTYASDLCHVCGFQFTLLVEAQRCCKPSTVRQLPPPMNVGRARVFVYALEQSNCRRLTLTNTETPIQAPSNAINTIKITEECAKNI